MGEDRGVGTPENRGERGARGGREKDERPNKYGEITQQCIIFRNRIKAKEREPIKKRGGSRICKVLKAGGLKPLSPFLTLNPSKTYNLEVDLWPERTSSNKPGS